MKHWQKTFLFLWTALYADMSFAAFNDYIVSALDTVNIQLGKVATLQDDYSAVAQEYTQGKLGEMGDLQSSVKQAKKVKQAQENLKKMQDMQKKLQKGIADAKKMKDDALAQVQEMQELKDSTIGAIKEAKDAYSQQVKAAQDLAQQAYEKANAQFEAVSAQAQEMQKKIDEQRQAQGLSAEEYVIDEAPYEAESNRAAFNLNPTAEITPLSAAMETMQYKLPQGIGEDGNFLPETAASQPMTMLPEVSALKEASGMIENAALQSMLPDQTMLQQLPDASQLLEASADDVLQQAEQADAKSEEETKSNEKSELSLEDQLLAADEVAEPKMSEEEFKALLQAKDDAKKAARPQRDIQAENEQFQQKLQAKDEAKRASLGLTSSRRSFGAAKVKAEGGKDE